MQTHWQGCWECVVGTAHETLPTRVAFWGILVRLTGCAASSCCRLTKHISLPRQRVACWALF